MLSNYDEHFTDDKLGIQPYVLDFAHLIEQETYEEGGVARVYSISAEFGIGKTFFCDKLKEILKVNSTPVTKMNIWEMDFYENPLIPILIKIQEVFIENNKSLKKRSLFKRIFNFIKAIGATLASRVLSESGFDSEQFIQIQKSLNDNPDIYDNYKQYENELEKLKVFLRNWAKSLNKPIVVIIDELDRCRPDYAVKTLEVLKHFFDISGFVFVLALDEEQLKNSVKCLFGTENFDGYRRKFINNSFILPEPDKIKFTNFL